MLNIFKTKKEPITMSYILIGYRLCVLASGSLITDIFSCCTLISVSCLHFGQYNGKFLSSVSTRILILVLLPHIGHKTHFILFIYHLYIYLLSFQKYCDCVAFRLIYTSCNITKYPTYLKAYSFSFLNQSFL